MNKYIFLVIVFFGLVSNSFSQKSLNDYSFVIVPEQFEFLNQKDKYQLNSIAEFLFNKHGFHAFKSNATPNAKRCDGLYAELVRVPMVLKTRFVMILKDCDGIEVFRTQPGISKFKEFKRAYQDALRKTFLTFEEMYVQQKDIEYFDDQKEEIQPVVQETAPKIEKEEPVKVKAEVASGMMQNEKVKLPKSKFTNYSRDGVSYLLRKTDEGYFLYEEEADAEGGLLLQGRVEAMNLTKIYFTDQDDKIFKATFDTAENLTIYRGDTTEIYKRTR